MYNKLILNGCKGTPEQNADLVLVMVFLDGAHIIMVRMK